MEGKPLKQNMETCSICIKQITGDNPYEAPMMIYPAVHYTMGGLWVDYNLMTTVPGLYALGEANFSDHGANRLGASALMQGSCRWIFCNSLYDWRLPGGTFCRKK